MDELGNKKSEQNRPIAEQLEHAIALTEPHELQELGKVKGRQVFLSDVHWESASVGFGEPLRDRFYVNPREKNAANVLLQVGGEFHKKGLYAHANSSHLFRLDGRWKLFECVAGLQAGAIGRVKFRVEADGQVILQTKEVAGSEAERISLNVAGAKTLKLIAESSSSSAGHCWTIWASPVLRR